MIEKRMIYLVARLYVFLATMLSRNFALAKSLMPVGLKKSWDALMLKLVYTAARMWVRLRRQTPSSMMHGFMRPAQRAFAMALVLMMVVGLLPGTLFVPAAQAADADATSLQHSIAQIGMTSESINPLSTPLSNEIGLHLLLKGFDVTEGGMLTNLSVYQTASLLKSSNQDGYPIDTVLRDHYDAINTNITRGSTYCGSTVIDMATTAGMNMSVSAKASVGMSEISKASAGAKYEETYKERYNSSRDSMFFQASLIRSEYFNRLNYWDIDAFRTSSTKNIIWENLAGDFKEALLTGDINKLFRTYGTHFITAYEAGGWLENTIGVFKTNSSLSSDLKSVFEANAGMTTLSTSIEATARLEKELNENKSWTIDNSEPYYYVAGGNKGLVETPAKFAENANSWTESFITSGTNANCEILTTDRLYLIGIWELLPDEYDKRYYEIAQAYFNESLENENSLLEDFGYRNSLPLDADTIQVDDFWVFEVSGSLGDLHVGDSLIPEDAIPITSEADLNLLRHGPENDTRGKYYYLTQDIELTKLWHPIENFCGTLDGQGCTISNIEVTSASAADIDNRRLAGLFAMVSNGNVIIRNLEITNANITATDANNQGIHMCYAGGLIGYVPQSADVTIENCMVGGGNFIYAENHTQYSIVGYAVAGGLIGYAESIEINIMNSCVTASVFAHVIPSILDIPTEVAGGMIGSAPQTRVRIDSSFVNGGSVSTNGGYGVNFLSYNGEFIGLPPANDAVHLVTNSYYRYQSTGGTRNVHPSATGIEIKNNAELTNPMTYSGWNFSLWGIGEYGPYLSLFNGKPAFIIVYPKGKPSFTVGDYITTKDKYDTMKIYYTDCLYSSYLDITKSVQLRYNFSFSSIPAGGRANVQLVHDRMRVASIIPGGSFVYEHLETRVCNLQFSLTPSSAVDGGLRSIFVSTPPTKIEYFAGSNFNPSGMIVAAGYQDFSTKFLDNSLLTFSPTLSTPLTDDVTSITISFEGKSTVLPITVSASNIPITYIKTISSGMSHQLAIKNDGSLWAWGGNGSGRLGLGDTIDRNVPVQVGADRNWVNISTGINHTVAIRADGSLWAWGDNSFGQLGLGDTVNRDVPFRVGSEWDWVVVSASSSYHTIGIKANGSLWAWGRNFNGQLGIGDTVDRNTPVQVGSDYDWVNISASSNGHVMAIKNDGSLWAWGNNAGGVLLGIGDIMAFSTIPVQVGTELDWVDVSVGNDYTIAKKTDGTLWTWGYNTNGKLGLGDTVNRNAPVQIDSENNWGRISAGSGHSLAIKTDGTLWAWGDNYYGQLGNGFSGYASEKTVPIQIGLDQDWADVSVASLHSMALKNDGTLWAWGRNYSGQLGIGDTIDRKVPNYVTNLADVPLDIYGIDISIDGQNSLDTHTFAAQAVGYNSVVAQTFMVRNTGNQATGDLDLLLSGSNANSFTLSTGTVSSIEVDGNRSFTIKPNDGLSIGTYTATVMVSGGNGISESFDVSFTVNPTPSYAATVNGGSGSGSYSQGSTVNINADTPPPGQVFLHWTSDPIVNFVDPDSESTSFIMPAYVVTVTANYITPVGAPTVSVTDATGRAGDLVTIQVMAENSPPLTMFNFRLNYPNDVLKLTDIQEPPGAQYQIIKPSPDDYSDKMRLTFNAGTSDFDVSGIAVNLTFEILENATAGEYEVALSDINASGGLSYESVPGTVTVIENAYGDFTGNGFANGEDATWILRYEAADYDTTRMTQWWPTTISTFIPASGDFTNDKRTNGEDATWILRYEAADYSANRMVQWWPSVIDFSHLGVGQPTFFTTASPLQDTLYTMESVQSAAIAGTHESGEAGGAPVTIQVIAENSPQLTMFNFKLSYPDDVLKLTDIQLPDGVSFGIVIPPSPDFYISGMRPTFNAGTSSFDVNGVVLNLTFEIAEGTAAGVYDIEFTDINASDGIVFTSTNGSITVISQQPCIHDWDDGVVTTPATCITEGERIFTCSVCGDTYTEVLDIDPNNHVGDTYEIVWTEPTCVTPGLRDIYCDDCDALLRKEAIAINPIRHMGGTYEEVITEATCIAKGELGIFCDDCDALLQTKDIEIDPNNHVGDLRNDVITEATCIATGSLGFYCDDCDALLSTEVIPVDPGNHTHGTFPGILTPATCITEGMFGLYCVDCHELIDDEVIPVDPDNHTGGTYHNVITPATHIAEGLMGIYCESCDALLDTFIIPIPTCGHEWDEGVVTIPATCESEGEMTFTCVLDGCGVQKTVLIPATGHDWGAWTVTTPAACESKGLETRVCAHDATHVESRTIPATGHAWVAGDVVAPTCVAEGYTAYTCALCGDTKQDDIVPIDPEAHDFDVTEYDWGKEYTCKLCGYAYQEVYPVPGNETAETLSRLAPSILKNGLSTDNLPLTGKVLRLVVERVDLILSANANNRNIEGEVALGDGYFLAFDIKGNGSNVKIFDVIDRNPPTQAYEASSLYEDTEEAFSPVAARLPVSEVDLVPGEDGSFDEIAATDDAVCNPDEDDDGEQADDPRKSEDWLLPDDDDGDITPAPDGNEPDADGDEPYANDNVADGAMEDDI